MTSFDNLAVMRLASVPASGLLVALLSAAPAAAAPTCQDKHGATVRCDVKAAMPVGWQAPVFDRIVPPAGNRHDMVIAAAVILLLLALIALLPEFSGAEDSDWQPGSKDKDKP